jgi:type IV secretory pathway protease TraF
MQWICSAALFVSILSLTVAVAAFAKTSICFPGGVSDLTSPNGLYTIKNVDQPVGSGNQPKHLLLFLRQGEQKKIALNPHRLYADAPVVASYDRCVDILWSPDSSAFVLNDWMGSNVASVYLYQVRDLRHPIDIGDKLFGALKDQQDKRSIAKSDHVYMFASKWISATVLEIKEAGHGPGVAFTFYYLWDLRKNSCKFIKRMSKEDLGCLDTLLENKKLATLLSPGCVSRT